MLVVLVGIGLVAWSWWPEPPRARQYRPVAACLLVDDDITRGPAASAWAGMQDASTESLARVQYIEIQGPPTAESATSTLAGLTTSGRCTAVVAVDERAITAARAEAGAHPDLAFVLVDGGGGEQGSPNVTVIDGSSTEEIREQTRREILRLVG
ncbi:hypothetical protein [Pseudonocardia oroxyli]|uniref:hypothetical protein n=1 Tax=Pseudonocardia oroxyli TaxID=366584 RepID=UPI000B856A8D|nr:hypothetical protein [Pseudonocardia oroxyli]